MRSLQFRLSLGLLVSLMLGFAVLWLLVSSASRYLAEDYIATRLLHDSETLLSAIQIDATGSMTLDTTRIDPIYKRPFSGYYYKITTNKASLRSRSLWDQDLSVTPIATGASQRSRITGPQQQPLLLLLNGYDKVGQPVTIAIAEDLSTIHANFARFQQHFALTAFVLLFVLIGAQGFMLHAGLRPLDKTRKELQALTRGQLTQLNPRVPKEIAPLVEEINRLLDVMSKRLTRSRNALGDLAHALKKPLTVLKQLMQDTSIVSNPTLQQSLNVQLDAMQRHMTRILHRARLAGEGPVGSVFVAEQEIPALLTTLHSMYRQKSLHIDTRIAPDITLAVDREDMLELIGNLLDNACKWAQHTVRLSLQRTPVTQLQIEDDGPGVADADLPQLTQRGLRLDETAEGHGLGLAIVSDIVANLGGTLQLTRSVELGGLHVTVTLPELGAK
jgi:signal transduction histidine kinase